jgi:hypothetical protein
MYAPLLPARDFFAGWQHGKGDFSMRVSARPEQVGKKQDYHESASRFELLEEARQKIPEDKDFEAVCQG